MSWLRGFVAAAVLATVLAPAAKGGPFVGVYMEARVGGATPGAWVTGTYDAATKTWARPVLAVAPGQAVDYKIYALWTGAVGTMNTKGTPETFDDVTITSLNPSGSSGDASGINSLKFNVYQSAADPIQVSFTTTSTLAAGWADGTGPSGGVVTNTGLGTNGDRGNGYANLCGIRPIQATGTYVGLPGGTPAPILLTSGTATVGGVAGSKTDSTILMHGKYPKDLVIGTFVRVNTPYKSVAEVTALSWYLDPLTVYDGVTLYQPWAEAALANVPAGGYAVDPTIGENLLLTADVGGSGHTVVHYRWTLSPDSSPIGQLVEVLRYDTLVPTLEVTAEDLLRLAGEHHTVSLQVWTDDGQNANGAGVPLTLLPEPATLALLGFGAIAVLSRRRAA